MGGGVKILGERSAVLAREHARAYVPILNSGWAGHDQCRKDAMEQIQMEVKRGQEETPPHGGNALYLALKELELAVHSSTMLQTAANMALLAALGVDVPVPLDELPTEEDTTQ